MALLVSWTLLRAVGATPPSAVDLEDNEFAEFEDLEEEPVTLTPAAQEATLNQEPPPGGGDEEEVEEEEAPSPPKPASNFQADDDEFAIVDEEDEDFVQVEDEEFEGFEGGVRLDKKGSKAPSDTPSGQQPLKFADVPAHLRNNWSNYQVELVMLIGLAAYLLNYAWGRGRNQGIASAWYNAHADLLQAQFALVGDDGLSSPEAEDRDPSDLSKVLLRDTDSSFNIWCSGRQGVDSMLITVKLLKRQDLVSLIAAIMRPKLDQVVIRVDMEAGDMDPFVFAFGQKKTITRIGKEMSDLSQYCTEKKNSVSLGLPSSFSLLSEIAEASTAMLDTKVVTVVEKYADCIDYIHMSDQYSGAKPAEGEAAPKAGEAARVLLFAFNLPKGLGEAKATEELAAFRPLLSLVFYTIERVRRFRLSREGKAKAERNRAAAAEALQRTTHVQRQEAAQARREERVRERKERVMAEEDPDKQRRLDILEKKREAKKKTPKMKQLKIKAM